MSFNEISNRDELAAFLGIHKKHLTYVLYKAHVESFYTSFDIPKKNGSVRHIYAPTGALKRIQTLLARRLLEYQEQIKEEKGIKANISHAFSKGKSIITNAQIHRNKRFIVCIDLKDYFETFNFGRVLGFFKKNNNFQLPHEVAVAIAQIACYNGSLPQGAPTSPVISNLISEILDYRLLKIAKNYHLDYTRYADDLTFSTNRKDFIDDKDVFLEAITAEIESSGFEVNESKTRIIYKDSQQIVTGLIVNKILNVPRSFYKDTRAMWHSYYKTGTFTINGEEGTCNQLAGRFSFINHLERYNKPDLPYKAKKDALPLSAREKEYRNFLFYTHFINNKKPVIVTEGKTDILYIKAALKSLYKDYPTLITRDKNGRFVFHISFFNRMLKKTPQKQSDKAAIEDNKKQEKTTLWEVFFGMCRDGADSIKRLYDFFSIDKPINLCNYFFEKKAVASSFPVVLLFDNEKNSKRPLREFISYAKLSPRQQEELELYNYTLLEHRSRLYLVAVPLPTGKAECEIEDLFTQETLDTIISGRSFSRKDEDKEKYYNKHVFSKYIYSHYNSIDFSGFRPLLQMIVNICNATQMDQQTTMPAQKT